jgi:beta-phosphoglucomutase
MTRAILFDFNGVIVNDEPQHCEALTATLAAYGYRLEREAFYREYVGVNDRECFRLTFERMGLPVEAAALRAAVERKAGLYEKAIRASMQLVPGVAEFIRAASSRGFRLAIVSGALHHEIELVLKTAALREHFAAVLSAEQVSHSKPDPLGYEMARGLLDVAADQCVAIEDSLPGLRAARRAGIPCAMLTTTYPSNALQAADLVWPDFVDHLPEELPWRC